MNDTTLRISKSFSDEQPRISSLEPTFLAIAAEALERIQRMMILILEKKIIADELGGKSNMNKKAKAMTLLGFFPPPSFVS